MWNFLLPIFVLATLLGSGAPLNFAAYEEGPCEKYTPQKDFNQTWLVTTYLPYIVAGSKHHLYRMVTGIPNYKEVEEDHFIRTTCLQSHENGTHGIRNVFVNDLPSVSTFQISLREELGVIDFTRLDSPHHYVSRHTVTLTDNESFVVFANCWEDLNTRAWDVISARPTLDKETQKRIKDHALSLGFDPANFVFFSGDNCDT